MEPRQTKTAITKCFILDYGSRMPEQDPDTLEWDWTADREYVKFLKAHAKYVCKQRQKDVKSFWHQTTSLEGSRKSRSKPGCKRR